MDLFKLVGTVFVDTDDANKNLQKTDSTAGGLQGSFGKLAKGAGSVAIAVADFAVKAVEGMWDLATSASETLDTIQKGAQQMDISYESYQKLSYACERSGTSISSLEKGVRNITNAMADTANGNAQATASYEALGVSIYDAEGNMRSTEEVLQDTLMQLADMEDTTQRNAIANDIFGASYADLVPLLNEGSDGIQELMNNAEDLGLVFSDDMVEAGATFGDQLADLKDSMDAVITKIGAYLIPVFSSILDWVLQHMPEIQAILEKVYSVFERVISAVCDAIEALKPVLDVLFEWICNGCDLIISAIEAIPEVVQWLSDAFTTAKETIMGAWDAICNRVDTAKTFIGDIVDTIKGFFSFNIKWPTIPMPHFGIRPHGWSIGDLLHGSIPSLSVDWYAKAMDKPRILDQAEIFGVNQQGQPMAGGEAGEEIVGGADKLMNMISEAVQKAQKSFNVTNNLTVYQRDDENMDEFIDRIQKALSEAMRREELAWA